MPRPRAFRSALIATTTLCAVAACGEGAEQEPDVAGTPETLSPDCSPENLETLTPGTLTIATDEPVFEPWFVDNDPANGQGFEGQIAAAVADELGFGPDQVVWVRVPFNAAIQPGPKTFDFDINEFSITDERREAVDFSSPYYDVTQAVIAMEGTPAADATSLADLQDLKIGAQVGTTSLAAIEEVIQPSVEPGVYNTNDDAKAALVAGQIDALVLDLPTAFFVTAAEIEGSALVGQLLPAEGEVEQFGLVLDKDSPLTECVSAAVDALGAEGVLEDAEESWLLQNAGAPVLE
ncbi:MAG TPA: ABC transporter substrate-binding protein [Jiangellaceae bacterium]|jgi:polar amino acid transport system substrate-binding protein|nr:ABC transporter substrate-binding protein [Jiangellaceae bacterium]